MSSSENFVIALDGGSGTGKSTTAKIVAKTLGITYLDTGAMYRAAVVISIDYFTQHQSQQSGGLFLLH